MNESQGNSGFPWSEWMESTTNMWLSAAQSWQKMSSSLGGFARTEECMQASLSMWRTFLAPWTGDKGYEAIQSQLSSLDIFQGLTQVMGSDGLSQELLTWLWDRGEAGGRTFEEFRHEAIRAWTGIYESAIQPLLNVPQLGLNRVYQEKINRLVDKFHGYHAAVSKFQMWLSGPMEKSFADLREEVQKRREKGQSVGDFKDYYGIWIKSLEKHYMLLFRSDEYGLALSQLLDETAHFRITGNDVLTELLEFLPIPTNKEMDELYKDLYTLKKQTKEAVKKISKLESALAKKDIG
jgi:hypothetical protein